MPSHLTQHALGVHPSASSALMMRLQSSNDAQYSDVYICICPEFRYASSLHQVSCSLHHALGGATVMDVWQLLAQHVGWDTMLFAAHWQSQCCMHLCYAPANGQASVTDADYPSEGTGLQPVAVLKIFTQ